MGRPRKYEPRWTGNIKPNGQKEIVWVKIERPTPNRKELTNDRTRDKGIKIKARINSRAVRP